MLKELEQGVNKLKLFEGGVANTESKKELVTLWNERFQFIQVIPNAMYKLYCSVIDFYLQTSFRTMEPVLNLRRVILGLSSRYNYSANLRYLIFT